MEFTFRPVGYVRSSLKDRKGAPRQGWEGAPDACLEIDRAFIDALDGLQEGHEIWILTCLHEARRDILKVRPRDDLRNPITGVFATRSPDRPNPIGMHRAKILKISEVCQLDVQGLEAIDGTPILDIKPVLERESSCGG